MNRTIRVTGGVGYVGCYARKSLVQAECTPAAIAGVGADSRTPNGSRIREHICVIHRAQAHVQALNYLARDRQCS